MSRIYKGDEKRRALVRSQGGRCFYCKRPIGRKTATLDHRIPKSQGGLGSWDNLVAACVPCNQAKGDLRDDQFLALLDRLARAMTPPPAAGEGPR